MYQRIAVLTAASLLAACTTPAGAPSVPAAPKPSAGAAGGSPAAVTPANPGTTTMASPTSGPPVIPVPGPVLTVPPEPPPLRLAADFEDVPLGDVPKDWVDVATEIDAPAWVYAGNWRVVEDDAGNRVFMHDDVRQQPAVSFQRYRGDALGTPDGQVPTRYHAEVRMRPINSPNNYPPTGDQGVQFYYLSPGHYVEVVVKPDQIEVWEADGAEPRTNKGWKRLWARQMVTKAGDMRHIGATIDVARGTFEAYLDGAPLATVDSALIKPQPAWVALRGIGNVVSFDDVRIEPLTPIE